jgi:phytoene/squalene synthetase
MSLLVPRPASAAETPADAYDAVAEASAALVIRRYSSSFGLASRLLAEPVRTRVRNIYALVRVADEIADAPRPGAGPQFQRQLLDALEAETDAACVSGHSANLVVHAFARTAARCEIGPDLTGPFFDSMRTDLVRFEHDQRSFERYVFGSAEVVGLMCLRAFVADEPDAPTTYAELSTGARRLGAAFQKLNFLRDLADDQHRLGRRYFPGIEVAGLTDRQRDDLLDDIDADLLAASAVIRQLPDGSRRAVQLAHALFAELSLRLRSEPAEVIRSARVRVSAPAKARVVARCLIRGDR